MTTLRNPRSVASRIGLSMLAFTAVTLVGGVITVFVVALTMPGQMSNMWMLWLMNDIPMYGLALPVYCLILHFVPDGPAETRPRGPGLGVGKYLLFLVFCIGSLYLFSILSQILVSVVDAFRSSPPQSDLDMLGGGELWVTILFVVLVPAVGEEFLFRYMLRKKLRGAGDVTYILVSGICFGLFHLNVEQLFYAFAIGAALAWLYLRTGRLWMCMLAHGLVNLMGTILVPELYEISETAYLIFLGFIIPATIVIFLLARKRIVAGLHGPEEPGWPGGPPQIPYPAYPWQAPVYGYPYPAPQVPAGYGYPYQAAPIPPPYAYPPAPYGGWNGYGYEQKYATNGINQSSYYNQYPNAMGYPPACPGARPTGWQGGQQPAAPAAPPADLMPPARDYPPSPPPPTGGGQEGAPGAGRPTDPPWAGGQKQTWRSGQGEATTTQPVTSAPQPLPEPQPQPWQQAQPSRPEPHQWRQGPPQSAIPPQPYGAYPAPVAAPPPVYPYYPYPPQPLPKVSQGVVFGNVGMVLNYVLCGLMILVSLFA